MDTDSKNGKFRALTWKNAYLGHFTKRERSLLGWMFCPMPKFRVRFSKSGLTTRLASNFLTERGAAATFLPTFRPFKSNQIVKIQTHTSLQEIKKSADGANTDNCIKWRADCIL